MIELVRSIQNSNDASLYIEQIEMINGQIWNIIMLFSSLVLLVLGVLTFLNTKYIDYSMNKSEEKLSKQINVMSQKYNLLNEYLYLRQTLLKSELYLFSDAINKQNFNEIVDNIKLMDIYITTQIANFLMYGEGVMKLTGTLTIKAEIKDDDNTELLELIENDTINFYLYVHLFFNTKYSKFFVANFKDMTKEVNTIVFYIENILKNLTDLGIEFDKMNIDEIEDAKRNFMQQLEENYVTGN